MNPRFLDPAPDEEQEDEILMHLSDMQQAIEDMKEAVEDLKSTVEDLCTKLS